MKTKKIIILLVLMIFVVGCSSNNKSLNKEDVISKVEESFKKLESISQEIDLTLNNEVNSMVETSSQEIDSIIMYNSDKNISHIYTSTENIAKNQNAVVEFYKTPEGIYLNDGSGWNEYNGPESYGSTYEPILNSFKEVVNHLEMTEDGNNYIFKFKGKDGNIFRKVGAPFNIIFNNFADDDVDLDIEYKVGKENFYLENLYINTTAEPDKNIKGEIIAEAEFKDFNEVKEVPVPEGLGLPPKKL